jgi:hypothetical protein
MDQDDEVDDCNWDDQKDEEGKRNGNLDEHLGNGQNTEEKHAKCHGQTHVHNVKFLRREREEYN